MQAREYNNIISLLLNHQENNKNIGILLLKELDVASFRKFIGHLIMRTKTRLVDELRDYTHYKLIIGNISFHWKIGSSNRTVIISIQQREKQCNKIYLLATKSKDKMSIHHYKATSLTAELAKIQAAI